jgi:hypothetical protein
MRELAAIARFAADPVIKNAFDRVVSSVNRRGRDVERLQEADGPGMGGGRGVRVVVLGSTPGGSGSGILVDIGCYARHRLRHVKGLACAVKDLKQRRN